VYTASRMLFALSAKGDAPKWMLNVTKRGVPLKAILTCTVFGFLSVIMSFISPDTVFQFLLNSSGAIALFVYLLISISQLILRRKIENETPHLLKFRMWGYPYITIASIIAITMIIGTMGFNSETRSQLVLSIFSVIIVVILYVVKANFTRQKMIHTNTVEDDIPEVK
jgi:GABA permease